MPTQTIKQKENCTLDLLKFVASILVAASHLPGLFSSELAEFYYNGWFFRFCVPLFFASSGYYFQKSSRKKQMVGRIAWLFALSYVLYLPQILGGAGNWGAVFSRLRWNLVIGYEHLWYLSAALAGLLVWYLLERLPLLSRLLHRMAVPVSLVLLIAGAFLDEHYRWMNVALLREIGTRLSAFGSPRNVVFMGLPLMLLGGSLARYEQQIRRIPTAVLVALWFVLRGLAFWECGWLLEKLESGLSMDMSLFGMWPGLVLLELSFRFRIPMPEKTAKLLRKLSEYIYILHPLVMAQISQCIEISTGLLLPATIGMCALIYILLEKQFPGT